jgi:hypothetical protein
MKKFWIILIAIVATLLIVIGSLVGYDIFQDRQNIVITEESIPAYSDWEPYPTKLQKPMFTLPPQTILKVKRIRYGKDYMAVCVETQERESGWIFSGFSFTTKKEIT